MTYLASVNEDAITLNIMLEPLTFEVQGQSLTLKKLPMPLCFSRKPSRLCDVTGGELCEVYVFKRIDMDPREFDHFSQHLSHDMDWLRGAFCALAVADARACLMVVATRRPILFIDTQGSCYARYVARLG